MSPNIGIAIYNDNDISTQTLKLQYIMVFVSWQTYGFLGFCLLMNSDVLVVNRLLRFIPGIRFIANGFVFLDVAMLKIAALRHCGLQVVAVTKKTDVKI